jgi:threonine/homoserine/homoserine lactone efflux protein
MLVDAVTTFWLYAFIILIIALAGCSWLLWIAYRADLRRRRRATHLARLRVKYYRSER